MCYFRYLDFFSKNNSFIFTERSNWNLDDGYPRNSENDLLVNLNPARTSGVSYYHRLRLMINMLDQEFLRCSSENFFFVRKNNKICEHNCTIYIIQNKYVTIYLYKMSQYLIIYNIIHIYI